MTMILKDPQNVLVPERMAVEAAVEVDEEQEKPVHLILVESTQALGWEEVWRSLLEAQYRAVEG